MPSTDRAVREKVYSGTLISDLASKVDSALERSHPPLVDRSAEPGRGYSAPISSDELLADAIFLRAKAKPAEFLQEVMGKLADRMLYDDEISRHYVRGWGCVQDVLYCILNGTTDTCVRCNCRQMEGMHGTQWARKCIGFVSADMSFKQALKNFDSSQQERAGC